MSVSAERSVGEACVSRFRPSLFAIRTKSDSVTEEEAQPSARPVVFMGVFAAMVLVLIPPPDMVRAVTKTELVKVESWCAKPTSV